MRNLIVGTLLAAGMIVGGGAASAQYREPRYAGPRYQATVVDRVIVHLDRARSFGFSDRREWKHIDQARRDLTRFQENWSRGRFDRGRLDNAIDHLNRVVNASWMPGREREEFMRDIYDLREFRSRRRY